MTIERAQCRGLIFRAIALLSVTWQRQVGLAAVTFLPDAPNELVFPAQRARYVRLVIVAGSGSQPCIDELEVYGDGRFENLALASHTCVRAPWGLSPHPRSSPHRN